jgi:hypothetical protein
MAELLDHDLSKTWPCSSGNTTQGRRNSPIPYEGLCSAIRTTAALGLGARAMHQDRLADDCRAKRRTPAPPDSSRRSSPAESRSAARPSAKRAIASRWASRPRPDLPQSSAQRSVRATPSVPARTSGTPSGGLRSPCIRRAHAGSKSIAACIPSACTGSAILFGAGRVNTSWAT